MYHLSQTWNSVNIFTRTPNKAQKRHRRHVPFHFAERPLTGYRSHWQAAQELDKFPSAPTLANNTGANKLTEGSPCSELDGSSSVTSLRVFLRRKWSRKCPWSRTRKSRALLKLYVESRAGCQPGSNAPPAGLISSHRLDAATHQSCLRHSSHILHDPQPPGAGVLYTDPQLIIMMIIIIITQTVKKFLMWLSSTSTHF